jgi:hypothetical protein
MPAPTNERQALEQERVELPGQIIAHQAKLAATPAENKARRERLMWQIRRVQKRMAEVDALLTGDEKLGHPQ